MRGTLRLALGMLFVLGVIGCGRKCSVSGTVTRDGKPLEWDSEGGHLLVVFIPVDRKSDPNTYPAETDRDAGTFSFARIPAGKYLVAVQQFDERHRDALGHAYNPGATTIEREVKSDGQEIEIDLPGQLPRKAGPPRGAEPE